MALFSGAQRTQVRNRIASALGCTHTLTITSVTHANGVDELFTIEHSGVGIQTQRTTQSWTPNYINELINQFGANGAREKAETYLREMIQTWHEHA